MSGIRFNCDTLMRTNSNPMLASGERFIHLQKKSGVVFSFLSFYFTTLISGNIKMIQIFGTLKNFDVKTAQRWFSERRISVQFVDLKEKLMSRGEFDSVVLKQFALDNCMSRMSKENHLNNEIYIHKLNCA